MSEIKEKLAALKEKTRLEGLKAQSEAEEKRKRAENPFYDVEIKDVDFLVENTSEPEFWETDTVIDSLTGCGLSKKSLTILIGGTGDGKSLLLTHLASKMSNKRKILYISFENTNEIDSTRFKDCTQIYEDMNMNNITYVNILEEELKGKFKWQTSYFRKLIFEEHCDYDVICVDAIQTTIDAVEQDEIHRVGNVLMKELYKIALTSGLPIFLTWQSARTASLRKMNDITLDDISGSYGTARYCTEAFFIKRDIETHSRKLKLLKTRGSKNARWDDPIIDLELSLRFSVEKIF